MIRLFRKSNFKCAEFVEDEENLLFLLICIRFGTFVVRRLKLALKRDSVVLGIPFIHINLSRHFFFSVHIFSRYLGQFSRITPPKRSKEMPTSYQFISSVPFLTLLLHFPKLKKPLDHRRPPCCWGKTLA